MGNTEPQAMTSERLAELRERLARWQRGYWLAGEKSASLLQNGDERHEIAVISAEHAATIDFLTHAYADMQALADDNERLRARETALVDIVRWVAEASETHATPSEYPQVSRLHFSGVGAAGWLRQKARALLADGLAAQDTQADGAAQGEICHECFGTGGFHHRIEDGVIVETVPDCLRCGGTSREPAGQPE